MNKFFYEIQVGTQVWHQFQVLTVRAVTRQDGFTTLKLSDGTATTRSDFDQIKAV